MSKLHQKIAELRQILGAFAELKPDKDVLTAVEEEVGQAESLAKEFAGAVETVKDTKLSACVDHLDQKVHSMTHSLNFTEAFATSTAQFGSEVVSAFHFVSDLDDEVEKEFVAHKSTIGKKLLLDAQLGQKYALLLKDIQDKAREDARHLFVLYAAELTAKIEESLVSHIQELLASIESAKDDLVAEQARPVSAPKASPVPTAPVPVPVSSAQKPPISAETTATRPTQSRNAELMANLNRMLSSPPGTMQRQSVAQGSPSEAQSGTEDVSHATTEKPTATEEQQSVPKEEPVDSGAVQSGTDNNRESVTTKEKKKKGLFKTLFGKPKKNPPPIPEKTGTSKNALKSAEMDEETDHKFETSSSVAGLGKSMDSLATKPAPPPRKPTASMDELRVDDVPRPAPPPRKPGGTSADSPPARKPVPPPRKATMDSHEEGNKSPLSPSPVKQSPTSPVEPPPPSPIKSSMRDDLPEEKEDASSPQVDDAPKKRLPPGAVALPGHVAISAMAHAVTNRQPAKRGTSVVVQEEDNEEEAIMRAFRESAGHRDAEAQVLSPSCLIEGNPTNCLSRKRTKARRLSSD